MKNVPDRLTGQVLNWQEKRENYKAIIEKCSTVVCAYPKKHYGWDEDQCQDFYLFFFDRMVKLIEGFQYNGMSFYAILNNTIALQLKTFYFREKNNNNKKSCLKYNSIIEYEEDRYKSRNFDFELTESACEKLCIDKNGRIQNKKISKRLIMLILKNSLIVDDFYIIKIATLTGVNEKWLFDSIMKLRAKCDDRLERLEIYRARASRAYMDLCRLQRKLGICLNELERRQLLMRIALLQERYETACVRRNSVHYCPSNSEIAEIMQIPKGTVDSGLYYLKKKLI
ncbi:MAG: acyl-CoA reductase [Spirochaetales bacterium]|nr:acyl-CoA reductase [Spirochaetales bacterium]